MLTKPFKCGVSPFSPPSLQAFRQLCFPGSAQSLLAHLATKVHNLSLKHCHPAWHPSVQNNQLKHAHCHALEKFF